jgi:hypothetical protein
MLGVPMLDQVRGHINCTDIVAENHSGSGKGMMKLAKKLTYPAALCNSMCNRPVFGLGAGTGNCSLPLGGPGDKIVTEVDTVA